MKRILTAPTLSAVLASPAWSINRAIWDSLTTDQQGAYLLGAFEMILAGEPDEPLQPYKTTLWKCYQKEKFDVALMHELVTESLNSSFWKHSNQESVGAGIHLLSALEEFCTAQGFRFN